MEQKVSPGGPEESRSEGEVVGSGDRTDPALSFDLLELWC